MRYIHFKTNRQFLTFFKSYLKGGREVMNKSILSMNHFYYRPQYPQIIRLPLENSTSYRIQIITILKWILLNQKNHQNEVESRHHQNTHQATHLNPQFFTFGISNFGEINGKEVDF